MKRRKVMMLSVLCGIVLFTGRQIFATDSFFSSEKDQCVGKTCQFAPNNLSDSSNIRIIIKFTKAKTNHNLQTKFTQTIKSLFEHTTVPLIIHIIGDAESQRIASNIIKDNSKNLQTEYKLEELDVDKLAKKLHKIVEPMQKHFSYKPGAYYSHALFFLSIAIHKVLPKEIERVIMLDADLKFKADVQELYHHFSNFKDGNIIGIGREMQPVYRHTFWQYRNENPGTRVGEPPPNGLTGFNSGVLLLDLNQMRQSKLYNSLLNTQSLQKMTDEFHFKGHLGDQDFFTLLNMKYEELFYVLPCEWNRQLCRWWEDKGYKDVFHQYFTCDTHIKIYHGNCNTPIPSD